MFPIILKGDLGYFCILSKVKNSLNPLMLDDLARYQVTEQVYFNCETYMIKAHLDFFYFSLSSPSSIILLHHLSAFWMPNLTAC